MNLTIIDPTTHPTWDDLVVTSSRNYCFFHSSAWAKVISESYNYKPLYFSVFNGKKLVAAIPFMEIKSYLTGKRGVSLPFTDYCEPIICNGYHLQHALDEIIAYGKHEGWRLIEMRGGGYPYRHSSLPLSYYYAHDLDLACVKNKIFDQFKSCTKRNIKKAIREDVKVEFCSSKESLNEFYRLNCMTRKFHGLPPQPYMFFKKIYEHILKEGKGFIVLGSHGGRIVAGAVFFHFGKKAIYKYGASDREYLHLRPNNLIMWKAIDWYHTNGYEILSLGRTEPNNKGLKQFKNGWGTKEYIINYYKYDLMKDTYIMSRSRTNGIHNKIFMKLPIPLLKAIGLILYRHVG